MNDSEMMKRLHSRDETVLAALDEAYGRLCMSVAKNILGSDEDAKECKNDALYKIWSTIPPAEPASLKAYAAMAARCVALNRWNAAHAAKRGETSPLDELAEVCGDDEVSDALEARELGEAINAFLTGCRREERIMFVRRYVYAEPPETVAEALGISRSAVNLKLFRLRGRLKKYLKERDLL